MKEKHSSQELEVLEPKLAEYLKTSNGPINDIVSHIINSGGKRIRPRLFLLCCELLGYRGEHRLPIAAVCEYIHTASLLHDDVIDNSPLRRGRPTVNSVWGDETAVLAGDMIYSAACRLMVKTASLDLIDSFAECIRSMSESELLQLQLLWKVETRPEEYLQVVHGKTAILFAASCQTPAFLAQKGPEVAQALFEYGKSLGVAFQIADDCLDYSQPADQTGKPAVADLFEGKLTLPLILALKEAGTVEQRFVQSILSGDEKKTEKNQMQLREIVVSSGGIEKSLQHAEQESELAIATLRKLTASHTDFQSEIVDELASLARGVLRRSS